MKKLVLFFCLLSSYALCQKLPDYGYNKVRITEDGKTMLFETNPVGNNFSIKPELWYSWYSANHVQSTQGGYSGKLLHGYYKSYYITNKNLMEEGFFNTGLRDGVWKSWKENGMLIQTTEWENGVINGHFSKYNDSGVLIMQGNYKNGLLDGQINQYVSKDSVNTTWYKNGIIVIHKPFFKRINPFKKKKQYSKSN